MPEVGAIMERAHETTPAFDHWLAQRLMYRRDRKRSPESGALRKQAIIERHAVRRATTSYKHADHVDQDVTESCSAAHVGQRPTTADFIPRFTIAPIASSAFKHIAKLRYMIRSVAMQSRDRRLACQVLMVESP
jgi:hypothetical protein